MAGVTEVTEVTEVGMAGVPHGDAPRGGAPQEVGGAPLPPGDPGDRVAPAQDLVSCLAGRLGSCLVCFANLGLSFIIK